MKCASGKHVEYSKRCREPHAGSSTCCGCDTSCYLDDSPYKEMHKKLIKADFGPDASKKIKDNLFED